MTKFLNSVLACLFFASACSDSESDLLRTFLELEPAGVLAALLRAGNAGSTRPAEPDKPGGASDTPCLDVTGTDISEMETLTDSLPQLITSALESVELFET